MEKANGWMDRLVKEHLVFQWSPLLLCQLTQGNMVPLSVYNNTAFLPNTQQHKISVSVHNSPSLHIYFACIQILLFGPDRNVYQSNHT